MESKYPTALLGDVAINFDRLRIPLSKKERSIKQGDYPYYGAAGILDHINDFVYDGSFLLVAEDGSVEEQNGLPVLQMATGKFWVSNHAHVLQGSNFEGTRFLYYSLRSIKIRPYLTGSVQLKLSQKNLNRIEIAYPRSERERYAITHVLGLLDDKIELNRTINETLETMAQSLFKSWFIDFDPVIDKVLEADNPIPDELLEKAERRNQLGNKRKSLPKNIASLFPDEFENSELGWIPKGWEIDTLDKIAMLKTKSIYPNNEPDTIWDHYSIPAFDETKQPASETGENIKSGKYSVPLNCVLASKLNPQFPRIWLPEIRDADFAICSTEFMPFVPVNKNWRSYLFELLKSQPLQSQILSRATGSTGSRQRVKPKEIAVLQCLLPSKEIVDIFCKYVSPWHDKQQSNANQSTTLMVHRDTLLPKLISGELRIPYGEKLVGEAGK